MLTISTVQDDTCTKVLQQINYISREEFFEWNPALQGNCDGLWVNYWYCVARYAASDVPMPPTVTTAPATLPPGTASNCVAWYQMTGSDTCELIAAIFGTFSEADFIGWNPDVWSDCSNIRVRARPLFASSQGKSALEIAVADCVLFLVGGAMVLRRCAHDAKDPVVATYSAADGQRQPNLRSSSCGCSGPWSDSDPY